MATILVVDDLDANIRLLEAVLTPRGHDVRGARSGEEALAALAGGDIDLVLLDIQMPGMNGYEVCRRIREDPATSLLPVVMITAAFNEEKVSAIEAGADDFVLRPFDQAELLARVRSLLRIKTYHDTIQGQAAELAAWNRSLEERVAEQLGELDTLRRLRRFLAPQLADAVLSAGDESLLDPHRREIAVLFCDLRGFTAFASVAEPEDVVRVFREFHEVLGELVSRHQATVGHFAGDGVMLFFGDPISCDEPARLAVGLAFDIRQAMHARAESWHRRGHELGTGMGISLGYATLGTIGFEGRYDYSAVGPVVNLASRLCDEAGPGEILVGARALGALERHVHAAPKGDLRLRGFPAPVAAWAIDPPAAASVGSPRLPPAGVGAGPAPSRREQVRFRVLGPVEVEADGATAELHASKERALLALLLVHRNVALPVDRLADHLWAGTPPESASTALRVHVSRLRKSLASVGADERLVTRPPGYLLEVRRGELDADQFESLAATGRAQLIAGEPEAAAATLRGALALWRGPALLDVATAPFAAGEAVRLEEARLAALEDRVAAELECGQHGALAGELEALVSAHPLRERLWQQRMVALYRSGRQADALRAYQDLRELLRDELGLEPSPSAARLEQAILAQDASLDTG